MPKSSINPETTPLSRNTRKALAGLHEFYKIGQSALRKSQLTGGRSAYGSYAMQEVAEGEGICDSLLYEARSFAQLYSQEEFDELIELVTTFNHGLGFSHVIELMKVSEPHVRKELQKAAAKRHWSVRNLRDEVRRVLGKA